MYWESGRSAGCGRAGATAGLAPGRFHRVLRRDLPGPHSWLEKADPNLIYFHEAARGGHFAAWGQPHLFSEDLRAGCRPLR
jgi:hypothetical protein